MMRRFVHGIGSILFMFALMSGLMWHSPSLFASGFLGNVATHSGLRAALCRFEWMRALAYYGTREENQSDFDFHNGFGRYPRFLARCQRVTQFDPRFADVYVVGAEVLGWNLQRSAEAVELLNQGLRHRPQDWRLPLYMVALKYERGERLNIPLDLLERHIAEPDCPNLLRALLANLYHRQNRYPEAAAIWRLVAQAGNPQDRQRALTEIAECASRRTT